MEMEKIREMDEAAIRAELSELERDIMKHRMENRIGTSENPVAIRFKKKDVARLKTVLRERELGNNTK